MEGKGGEPKSFLCRHSAGSKLTPPVRGPLTVGAMYRTTWALFKIGAQLPLQVQSLNISHFP